MSSDPTSGDLGVGSVLNDRPTVTIAQHRHVSSVRVDAEAVASGNQSTSIADAHVNAGVNTTISIAPSVEKKCPFVSVRKLMPPQFFKEGEDDEDLAIEEAEVPENSKTWWQTWGGLVIFLSVLTIFLVGLLLFCIFMPIRDWLLVAKAWVNSHTTEAVFYYLFILVVSIMLVVPSSLIELFGVIVMGPYVGFALNVTANMIAAAISFPIGGYLFRSWIRRTIRQSRHMLVLVRAVYFHPFRAILIIRFLYLPTGLKNYAIGAIPGAPFWTYMICTFIATLFFSALLAAMGTVAEDIITHWHATPLEIVGLVVSVIAFILFFVLIYYASRAMVEDMEREQDALIASEADTPKHESASATGEPASFDHQPSGSGQHHSDSDASAHQSERSSEREALLKSSS